MDLRSFREDKLKIKTQAAFAELIGVEQSSISRWEKDPENIPYQVIQRILEKTGASYEELTGWKKPIPEPLRVEDTWKKVDLTKTTLQDYIVNVLDKTNIPETERALYINDLCEGIKSNLIKPKVAVVGRSDTGKSTLINALIGNDKMPTAWTPTTSIAVYLKHISDRPAFIEEDAWVFAAQHGEERTWNEKKLYDEAYCRAWKIGAGGAEILQSFGTRQGENYDKDAGSAVLFIDAPILKACDIIDLPGFGTETESDDEITFRTAQQADVIIYLSQANGFMRIEDITYLKRNINELPVWERKDFNALKPLCNLFIVASQAHTVNNGNRVQLREILDVGCKSLLKTFPDDYLRERGNISGYEYSDGGYDELRARFFAYTTDIPDICTAFNAELKTILETLPTIINEMVKTFVKEYVASRKPNLINEINKYEGIIAERDRYEVLLEAIKNNEISRMKDNDFRKQELRNEISQLQEESRNEFLTYMSETINIDALVQLMRNKGIKNKKEDVELFGSSIQSMLQTKCETLLKEKSQILSEKSKDYIIAFSESIAKPFENNNITVDFDATWAFVSTLSRVGVFGGFGSFLGSTITGALILSSAGFSIGSAIIGGTLSTPILGPIGIVLGLLIASGLGVVKLFGGGWEKNVAKKIVKAIEENKIEIKYSEAINEYWNQAKTAFEKAAEDLDNSWNDYVKNLEATVSSFDINEIQNKIDTLRNISDFFDNIPL